MKESMEHVRTTVVIISTRSNRIFVDCKGYASRIIVKIYILNKSDAKLSRNMGYVKIGNAVITT